MSEQRRVPIEQQIACVKRELMLRRRNYPKWVAAGTMTEQRAHEQIELMEAVHDELERIRKDESPERDLF
jgi:hypothetical protein